MALQAGGPIEYFVLVVECIKSSDVASHITKPTSPMHLPTALLQASSACTSSSMSLPSSYQERNSAEGFSAYSQPWHSSSTCTAVLRGNSATTRLYTPPLLPPWSSALLEPAPDHRRNHRLDLALQLHHLRYHRSTMPHSTSRS